MNVLGGTERFARGDSRLYLGAISTHGFGKGEIPTAHSQRVFLYQRSLIRWLEACTGVAEGGQVQDSACFDFGLLDNAQPFGWVPAGMSSTQRRRVDGGRAPLKLC